MVVDPCGGRAPMTTHQHLPCTVRMDVKSQVDVHLFCWSDTVMMFQNTNKVFYMDQITDGDR